jgi:hypothetical protein
MASDTADLEPVITVDWDTVEDDLGREVEADLRHVIEHTGTANGYTLDKWGYADEATTALSGAVEDHGRVLHPERGPLDSRYAPFRAMGVPITVFRVLRGEDRNLSTIIKDGPDEAYLDGLADLYDAARTLDARHDDWREDQHPAVRRGSYGPDQLGDLYIHVGHDDQSAVEGINVEDLPVEREHILDHGDHYTASYRHERYYSPEEPEPTIADERADEIGFLGANAGKRTLERDFRENEIVFEEVGTVELGPADPDATLYEYEKADETRYGVEWIQRIAVDDYVVRSLIFDHEPDTDAVATALTIEDHRQD